MDLTLAPVHEPSSHTPRIECATHLRDALVPERAKQVVKRIVKVLRKQIREGNNFDAIAARGLSGILIVPMVAMALKKTMLIVRKGEQCHSGRTVEGDMGARNYVVIDDFISSGRTVENIIESIAIDAPMAQCVGMLSYNCLDDTDEARGWRGIKELTDSVGGEARRLLKNQAVRSRDYLASVQSIALNELATKERNKRIRGSASPKPSQVGPFNYVPAYAFDPYPWNPAPYEGE